MNAASPSYLGLLPVVVALGLVMLVAGRRHVATLQAAFPNGYLERVLPGAVRARRAVRDVAVLLGLVLAVIALAEPRYDKEIVTVAQNGVDLTLVVDLSHSMNAADVDPSRLERARREILDLLDALEGDRVGLVVYAGAAFPRLPLTRDHDALRLVVRELDSSTFVSQGSALGEAIRAATLTLTRDETSQAGKAMIVLSDGEVHDVEDALAAAREAAAAEVRIYAMGIGEEGAPVVLPDGTFLTWEGKTVISTPSDAVLKDVARLTGGAYVKSVASADDIQGLYRGPIRGSLTAGRMGEVQREVWQTGFQAPLLAGVLLLLGAHWLGDGRKRLRGTLAAIFLAFTLLPGDALAATVAEADAAYRARRYADAERMLMELIREDAANPELYERLGAARYRKGDYAGARRAFEAQDVAEGAYDPETAYNIGNACWQEGRLEDAKAWYEAAERRDAAFQKAIDNREIVEQEIATRRAVKPPQDGEGGKSGQGGGGAGEGDPQSGGAANGANQEERTGEGGAEAPESSSGQPGQGEPGEKPNESKGDQQGNGSQSSGDRSDPGDGNEPVKPGDAELAGEGAEGGDPGEGAQGAGKPVPGGESGGMTAQQAERMLQGVEEGRPRVVVNGPPGGKPW